MEKYNEHSGSYFFARFAVKFQGFNDFHLDFALFDLTFIPSDFIYQYKHLLRLLS